MTDRSAEQQADTALKERHRAMWAAGDYPELVRDMDRARAYSRRLGISNLERMVELNLGGVFAVCTVVLISSISCLHSMAQTAQRGGNQANPRPATAEEILELFRRLNDEGTTLIVVTHDDRLAAEAGRAIHMLDGTIRD